MLALAACSSAPTHFYTLVPPAAEASTISAAPFLIEVQPVGIPPQVDQPQLVLRHGDGGVTLLDSERWIAPLGDEVRGALSANLTRALNTQDVYGLPRAGSKPVVRVKMDVRRLDAELGGDAVVESVWTLRLAGGPPDGVIACSSQVREPAGGDYAGVVRAQQRALDRIAAQMVMVMPAVANGQPVVCPK
jgi:uncharacterized lipoprotein YmbA